MEGLDADAAQRLDETLAKGEELTAADRELLRAVVQDALTAGRLADPSDDKAEKITKAPKKITTTTTVEFCNPDS